MQIATSADGEEFLFKLCLQNTQFPVKFLFGISEILLCSMLALEVKTAILLDLHQLLTLLVLNIKIHILLFPHLNDNLRSFLFFLSFLYFETHAYFISSIWAVKLAYK
jgi:hypothetical protein